MVKNSAGGNKAKKYASKSLNISNRATRFASEKGEIYAIVTRMMGNNICEVLCIDGYHRLCVIRGKFLGKGKRDNMLVRGKWILIGQRDWEITKKEKEKCDLLEVYNDMDKEKLIKNSKENFRIFLSVTNLDDNFDNNDEVEFINNQEEELFDKENLEEKSERDEYSENEESYKIEKELEREEQVTNNKNTISSIVNKLNEIDIDDI